MQISLKNTGRFADALRDAGFRATLGRVALLEALAKAGKPASVEELAKSVTGKLDLANAYRALEAFTGAGLVRRTDVGHRHMHYELGSLALVHRHSFVCAACGARAPRP